jgi:hypothetical protein
VLDGLILNKQKKKLPPTENAEREKNLFLARVLELEKVTDNA